MRWLLLAFALPLLVVACLHQLDPADVGHRPAVLR